MHGSRMMSVKKEKIPVSKENKSESTLVNSAAKSEWVPVGSKRKSQSKGKVKGKENLPPAGRDVRKSRVGRGLIEASSNSFTVLNNLESHNNSPISSTCVGPKAENGMEISLGKGITEKPGCGASLSQSHQVHFSRLNDTTNLFIYTSSLNRGSWLGGDFNGTLLFCERKSSATFRASVDRDFIKWVEQQDMRDVGFAGPEFTWKRVDHRPLLTCSDKEVKTVPMNRPFRFIAAWVLHDQFDNFVRQSWSPNMAWVQNTDQFTAACTKWNKEVFRHTEGRKKKLLRRLDGINRVVSQVGMQPKYETLQFEIWKELEDVLLQESLIWAQKARAEWSVFGDRNTRYFHARANLRRKSQRIEAIKDGEGKPPWIKSM
ncbi:hypothetical protein K1719_017115 [Acacia pycnantha]|nr:hypothetical protein K1719_017115 [Acacia pycnantha]